MNHRSYNAISKEWDTARSTLQACELPFLKRLTADLHRPARLLDLGCGTGRPIGEYLLQKGFSVTGVDQSENLLALAKERLPQGRWVLSSMETFEPDEVYDGAVIWDALFHLPRQKHEAILQKVLRNLRPNSRMTLTVGGSDHPAFTDTMFGQSFYYDSHPPETITKLLETLGATIEHGQFINPPTDGRDKGRYGIVARVDTAE